MKLLKEITLFMVVLANVDSSATILKSTLYNAVYDANGRRLCAVGSQTTTSAGHVVRSSDCAMRCLDSSSQCVAFNVYDNTNCELLTCNSFRRFLAVDSCKAFLDAEYGYMQNMNFDDISMTWPRDCSDLWTCTKPSDFYGISINYGSVNLYRSVYCDFSHPGQSWLVFQRRKDGSEDFYRTWKEYADGFGNLLGEFWLGNRALYALTNAFNYKLRIEMEDLDGNRGYAEYSSFKIASSADYYRLNVSGYSGTAGDSLSYHSGCQFSTMDADHDKSGGSCAQGCHGAWWYNKCIKSNLNSRYMYEEDDPSYLECISWITLRGYPRALKFTEMKIARV